MKLIFVLSLILSLSLADKLPINVYSGSAPYPPSGWKPNGAGLQLPATEYGPPKDDDSSSDVEITQERIEYAGQLVESSTITDDEQSPNNSYLPPNTDTDSEQPSEVPTTDSSLNVQGLPPTDSPVNFNSQYRQLNTGEFIPSVGRQQQQQRVLFNRQNVQQFGQIRQRQQAQQFQQFRQPQEQQAQQFQQFRQPQAQQQQQQFQSFPLNGRIQTSRNLGRFTQQQQQFGKIQRQDVVPDAPQENVTQQGEPQDPSQEEPAQEQPPQEPFDQYGPPPATSRQPKNNEPNFNNNNINNNNNDFDDGNQQQFNDEDDTQSDADHADDDDANTDEQPAIAVANSFSNGQYYILSKDNTLQRVIYMTTQTEEDRINNGFTAQLRYSPVEPIQDPIYAFDTQGQLIRIYNKK